MSAGYTSVFCFVYLFGTDDNTNERSAGNDKVSDVMPGGLYSLNVFDGVIYQSCIKYTTCKYQYKYKY